MAQHVAYGEELRLLVGNDAAVWRDVHLAVGESIQGVERLVRRHSRSQVYKYLHLGGGVVVHLARLYLTFLYGAQYCVNQCRGGLAERQFANGQSLVVELLYLSPHLYRSAAPAVVILAHINASAGGEIRVEMKLLAVQIAYGSVANLAEVVWQYLGA